MVRRAAARAGPEPGRCGRMLLRGARGLAGARRGVRGDPGGLGVGGGQWVLGWGAKEGSGCWGGG